jgi:hypothetical protein
MSRLDPQTDARLWDRIRDAKGNKGAFKKSLEACGDEELIELAALALNAAHAIRAPYEGPFIPSLNACLSEDGTEDFANWVVDQGRARWLPLVGADDVALARIFESDYDRKGVNAAASIFVVASARLGGDAYFDALESVLDEAEG